MTKIVQLTAENVKRLRAVEITPDGNLVIIGGANSQGKTSVLDAIEWALAGKGAIQGEPVRKGQEKATITIKLDGEPPLTVKRTITANGGGALTITTQNGARLMSPQTILDKLCGAISFDPLDFTRQNPQRQVEILRGLVGLDFTAFDAERKEVFDRRTEYSRRAKVLKAQADGISVAEGTPDCEVSVADLMVELRSREEVNLHNVEAQRNQEDAKKEWSRWESQVEGLERQLASAKKSRDVARKEAEKLAAVLKETPSADTEEIALQIEAADRVNSAVRAKQQRALILSQYEELTDKAAELTGRIAEIDLEKKSKLAEANWPVAGLGFDESGVTYNDLPLEQSGSAEQLEVSVAIGAALNPGLRTLLVRDGSLMDNGTLARLAHLAEDADMQVFVERVGDEDPTAVVIEDGMVRSRE